MHDSTARRPGRPSGRRGSELLTIARGLFLEQGYAGTTMQEVASRAGISKASLYREHASKDALFAAVVSDWAARGREAMRPFVDQLGQGDDLHGSLVQLARTIQAAVLAPDVVQMRRLVAAEADRFPDVATRYLVDSWDSNIGVLADAFAALHRRGAIQLADALIAAHQFTWTAVGSALNSRTVAGARAAVPSTDLERLAVAAADAALAAPPPRQWTEAESNPGQLW